jgi:CRISPR-associated protein Csm4
MTCATNVYDAHGWSFTENGGLYFILEINDPAFLEPLRLCLHLLGEAGIGADRSVGFGIFQMSLHSIEPETEWGELFAENAGPDCTFCTLSLVCPGDNAEAREALSYDLIPRQGWITSNSSLMQAKRRKCHMFTEGSLFRTPILGHLADVTPSIFDKEHQVWRYGLALTVSGIW